MKLVELAIVNKQLMKSNDFHDKLHFNLISSLKNNYRIEFVAQYSSLFVSNLPMNTSQFIQIFTF